MCNPIRLCFAMAALGWILPAPACLADVVKLREEIRAGDTARVDLQFKVTGVLQVPHGSQEATSLKLSATGKIAFEEKVLAAGDPAEGTGRKSLRYYTSASVDSVTDQNRVSRTLREKLRLMVAELRGSKPFLFSPSGPLTADEQDLLEGQIDSHVLGGLLPSEPVAAGQTWKPSSAAVAALFDLDTVTTNQLQAQLKRLDEQTALVAFGGQVGGATNATQTQLDISGQLVFDRMRASITELTVTQREERRPGPIEPGFKVEATFQYRREPTNQLTYLNSRGLEGLPLTANRDTEQLVYQHPQGRYHFYFPRGWQVYYSDPHVAVLRLIEGGDLTAQCNVSLAPTAAAGQHMKPTQFRAEVRQALGPQFRKFVRQGEVPAQNGYWIYRLAAVGAVGDLPVLWYYYLAAGPQGQQLVFAFTLDAQFVKRFGPRDVSLVQSLQFGPLGTALLPK